MLVCEFFNTPVYNTNNYCSFQKQDIAGKLFFIEVAITFVMFKKNLVTDKCVKIESL